MKLIDSSCWVDYYRPGGDARIQEAVVEALESDEAAICGMIRIEILGYIARRTEYDDVSEDFSSLHKLPLTAREFAAAVTLGRALRAKGGQRARNRPAHRRRHSAQCAAHPL